jgi:hypothetical protein
MIKPINLKIYTPDEIQLANALAEGLNDTKNLSYYLYCSKKYPKEYLLDRLVHVCSLPDHTIRTTRARLFTNIVQNSAYNIDDIVRD